MNDDFDAIELAARRALWICFAVAIVCAVLIPH